jgi:hypothetical protein
MEHAVKRVWIDPSWLSWEYNWDSAEPLSYDIPRPYVIHQHACDRLASNLNEFDRADAIMSLRRSVGHRVKALKEIYNLRDLLIGTRSMKDLELLSEFGIIRTFMLRRLVDIRNIVEHHDANPPPTDECLMFADLVWYFLRSTDELVRFWYPQIFFNPPGKDYHSKDHAQVVIQFCQCDISPLEQSFGKPLEIEAWIDPSSFTYEPRADWIMVEPSEITKREDVEPIRVVIKGKVLGTDEQMKHLYEIYFRVSHLR